MRSTATAPTSYRSSLPLAYSGVVSVLYGVLPGLHFTDYHKFLVSAGGLSVGASVALPILLLRSQKALFVTEKQVAELSLPAAKAIHLQQHQALLMLKFWFIPSCTLFLVGLALMIYGSIKWKKRQEVVDQRDASEIVRNNAEARKLNEEANAFVKASKETEDETVLAIDQEVTLSEAGSSSDSESSNISSQQTGSTKPENPETDMMNSISQLRGTLRMLGGDDQLPNVSRSTQGIISYMLAQEQAALFLYRLFKGQCEITRGVKTGSNSRADFVVTSRAANLPNIIAKVARAGNHNLVPLTLHRIEEWIQQAPLDADARFNAHYRPVVFLVLLETNGNRARMLASRIDKMTSRLDTLFGSATFIIGSHDDLDNHPLPQTLSLDTPTPEIIILGQKEDQNKLLAV